MSSAKDNQARHERLMAHFDALCDLGTTERAPLLEKLRSEDAALAEELSRLLRHDSAGPDALEAGAQQLGAMVRTVIATAEQSGQLAFSPTAPDASSTEAPASLVAQRYRVGKCLGKGGGGSVFLAHDLSTAQDVAIKFLRSQTAPDPRDVCRFRREFRAISRLEHPGCLKVFAEGIQNDQRYIVMEYVAGGDLERHVGGDPALLLGILVRLAGTLEYVHRNRIVHRDLKPQNVLLCPGEPLLPKLADFGIAKVFDDETTLLSETGSLIGTIDYLSPEQVQGQPVDPRTDLFALGCMIYKLWAGRPPYLGNTFERLSARVRGGAPPLRQLTPNASPGLEALALRLLEPDPAQRPQSALEVGVALLDLLRAQGGANPELASWISVQSSKAFLYRPRFLGRTEPLEQVLSQVRNTLAGAANGPALIAICGEAGLGKSELASVARRRIEIEGAQILIATVPAQSAGPLAPFPELQASIAGVLGVPHNVPHAVGRLHQDGAAARRRQATALAAELRELHGRRSLCVLFEDLHYATASAIEYLGDLMKELAAAAGSGSRPILIATTRPEGRAALAALSGPGHPVAFVELPPLDATAIAAIAESMLGLAHGQLPERLSATLQRESSGSPLLLQSALNTLASSGGLVRTERGWSFHGHESGKKNQAAAEDIVLERLSRLSAATRPVLEAAAVIGVRFDVELLVQATGLEEDAVMDALDEALRGNLLHPLSKSGRLRSAAASQSLEIDTKAFDIYEFEHVRIVEALYHGMDAMQRKARHLAIATGLRSRPDFPAASLAHHFSVGGERSLACQYFLTAGKAALAGYDYAAARGALMNVIALSDALPESSRAAVLDEAREGLADAQMRLGEAREAVQLFSELLRDAPPSEKARDSEPPGARLIRVRRLRKQGLARLRAGNTAGALGTLELALDAAGDRLPRSRLRLHLRLAVDIAGALMMRLSQPRPVENPELEERALIYRELALLYRWVDDVRTAAHNFAYARAAGRLGDPELLIDAYSVVAMFLAFIGWAKVSAWVERRTRALALSKGDRLGLARLTMVHGGVDVILHGDPKGLSHLDEGVNEFQSLGDPVYHAWSLSFRGWAAIMASRFNAANEDFARALGIADQLGLQWLQADAGCAQALTDTLQGRFEEADKRSRSILANDVRLALPAVEGISTEVLGGIAFFNGRYRDALAQFERAQLIYENHHIDRGWGFLMQISLTEARLLLAEQEGAAAVPDLEKSILRNARVAEQRLGRLWHYRGTTLVLRGVYHSRCGQAERAKQLFAQALKLRPPPRATYIDSWLLWRVAFELHRMGEPAEKVLPLLREVEEINEVTGMRGVAHWLILARKLYGI